MPMKWLVARYAKNHKRLDTAYRVLRWDMVQIPGPLLLWKESAVELGRDQQSSERRRVKTAWLLLIA